MRNARYRALMMREVVEGRLTVEQMEVVVMTGSQWLLQRNRPAGSRFRLAAADCDAAEDEIDLTPSQRVDLRVLHSG
jgi:hypothetical protein